MKFFNANIKYLRKEMGLSQTEFGKRFGLERGAVDSYEGNRAVAPVKILIKLTEQIGVKIDELLNIELSKILGYDSERGWFPKIKTSIPGQKLNILPIVVDEDNNEFVTVVPIPAQAGYLAGYGDPEYIEYLPRMKWPFHHLQGTGRFFQIQGESMLPIEPGSYILTEYVLNLTDIKNDKCYVLVSKNDGIVYKRVFKKPDEDKLLLKSDNVDFEPYEIDLAEILQVWKAVAYLSLDLPHSNDLTSKNLTGTVMKLQQDVKRIKQRLEIKN